MLEMIAQLTPGDNGIYQTGYPWAALLPGIALFWGILKCLVISKRSTTNTLCVLSLTLALSGWLGFVILGALYGVTDTLTSPLSALIVTGFRTLLFTVLIAGLVIGIVGLVHYSRNKPAFTQGRHQAAWGIVLCSLMLAIGIGSAVSRATRASSLVASVTSPAPGEFIEFDEFNFRIRMPKKPWVRFDVKTLNPDATVGFMRRRPEIFSMVVAERPGIETDVSLDGLAAVVEANLAQAASEVSVGPKRHETVSGIDGLRFESTATIAGKQLDYFHWATTHNGYVWQLITAGERQHKDAIRRAARQFARSFQPIDRDRVLTGAALATENVRAPQFGYEFQLAQSGWAEWTNLRTDFPDAHSGAIWGTTHAVGIVALRLDGFDPSDSELASALLSTLNIAYPQGVTGRKAISHGNATGYAFQAQRVVNGTRYTYQLHLLRNSGFAYLLAGWFTGNQKRQSNRIDDVMARVKLLGEPKSATGLNEHERTTQARLFEFLGTTAYTAGHFDRAVDYFKQAFSYNEDSETLFNAIVNTYNQLGRHDDALAFLDEHERRFAGDDLARANRAYQLARTGSANEAIKRYAELFEAGFENELYLDDYLQQLAKLQRFDDAHTVIDAQIQKNSTQSRRLSKAELLTLEKKTASAADLLRAVEEESPTDPVLLFRLAGDYLSAGEFSGCRRLCERLIEQDYNVANVVFLKGQCEVGMNRYPEAKDSIERAVKLDPGDPEKKQWLAQVSGSLGQGHNSSIKDPIEPVPFPASILDEIADLPSSKLESDDKTSPIRVMQQVLGIEFVTGSHWKSTVYNTFVIQTRQGVSNYNTLTLEFDPLIERIFVNRLTVKDPSGATVATGDVDTYYVADDANNGAFGQAQRLHVPVPGLAPGYVLEYTVTKERLTAPNRWPFHEDIFARTSPARYRALFVRGDIKYLAYESSDAIHCQTEPDAICWSMVDPPLYTVEQLQPRYDSWLPTIALADKRDTWPALATEYLDAIADRMPLDDPTRDLAARLTQDANTTEEALMAVARHVQQDYTYNAIEFGLRAMTPNAAAVTIRTRYGDCKDHALLLHHLLEAAHIPADLALMSMSRTIRPELPTLGQFDHMIVHTRTSMGERFIDCTNKHADVTDPSIYDLADKQILILDRDAPRLTRTAKYPDDRSTVRLDRSVRITDQAHASVEESVTFEGVLAERMRALLSLLDGTQRREIIQRLLAPYGDPQFSAFDLDGLNSPEKPLTLDMAYRVPDVFHGTQAELAGRLPAIWESYLLKPTYSESRRSPFLIEPPIRIRSTVRFALPTDLQPVNLTALSNHDQSVFLDWDVAARQVPGAVEIDSSVYQKSGRFAADEYGDYHLASEELLRALSPRLALRQNK